jgi:hypothetical protein
MSGTFSQYIIKKNSNQPIFIVYSSYCISNTACRFVVSLPLVRRIATAGSSYCYRWFVVSLPLVRRSPPECHIEASRLPFLPILRTGYLYDRKLLAANTRFSEGGLSVFFGDCMSGGLF